MTETLWQKEAEEKAAVHPERERARAWAGWGNAALGFLISGLFLFLALRGFDVGQVGRALRSAFWPFLAVAATFNVAANILRGFRWKALLGLPGEFKTRYLLTSLLIGYLVSNVLPARLGELARIYVLERKARVSKSTSAATIVVERVTDTLLLTFLLGVFSFFLPLPEVIKQGSLVLGLASVMGVLLLSLLAYRAGLFIEWAGKVLGRFSAGLVERANRIAELFAEGLGVLREGRRAGSTLVLTVVIWALEMMSTGFVLAAFGLELPPIAPMFVLVVLSLSQAIPAAPGSLGTFEFFATTALLPFAVERSHAVSIVLVLHALVYVVNSVMGLVSLWIESVSFHELITGVKGAEPTFND
jgi:uncharacterized protein (TIRG00374 family)